MDLSILPIFRTSLGIGTSLLTLDPPGKAKPGNPLSVFDLSQSAGLKEVTILDERIDGYLSAYKVADKLGVQLNYGLKLTVCADVGDKTPESRLTESRIILLFRNSQAYHDSIKIWNRAWGHAGSFNRRGATYGRTDWKTLKWLWTENLDLGLPFFSSFIARNTLSFARIVPQLPTENVWIFRELDSRLPFAPLIDSAIDRYTGGITDMILPSKTILYARAEDFKAYVLFRAIHNRKAFDSPDEDHLASDRFSFSAWQELQGVSAVSP